MSDKITQDYVIQRIDEWIARLNSLYELVKSWLRDPEITVQRSEIRQRNEDLMRRFNIDPRNVPVLTILKGKKRITFVPSTLWIIGADGRVNITKNSKQYILVDMRQDYQSPANWHIVSEDIKKTTIPFDVNIFYKILEV